VHLDSLAAFFMRHACFPFVLFLAFSPLTAAAAPQVESTGDAPAARMDVELLWRFARVATPTLSPDGRWVAFTLTRYDLESNASDSDIWLIPADGSRSARALTSGDALDSRPQFSPDGRRLAFLTRQGDAPVQVRIVDLFGGEPQPATKLAVPVKSFRWMPDGRRLVIEADTWPDLGARFDEVAKRTAELKADKTQARISETRVLRYWDHYLTDGRVPHLYEIELANGRVRDLLDGFARLPGLETFEWTLSPDGGEIAYSANATAAPYATLNYDVFALDLATGRTTNLTADNPGSDASPVYAQDSRALLLSRSTRPDIGSDQNRIVYLDRKGGSREIAAALDAPKRDMAFSADGRSAIFTAQQAGRVHLFRAALSGGDGTATRLAKGGAIDALDVASSTAVFLRNDFGHPSELHALALDTGLTRRLTGFNDARAVSLGRVEEIRFTGAGGGEVQSWLVHPPGARAGQKLPLVVLTHGGPFSAFDDAFSYRWNPHVFAARGYLVAMPNFHGSTGFGQAFADSILGNHGEKPAADVMALVDTLIGRGLVDEHRMAVAGGSYGGYLSALMTGVTTRFKAAIVHAGVFDISAQFASDSQWDRPASYGNAPWTDPLELDRWSPSRFVPKMVTPTLILHGEKDFRVPVTQGINLHGALTGKGVPSRIVIFPDENHWIMKPQASRLWHREVLGWLDRYIGPQASK
jgi:dipeptidyl aminopeptidase/acylaminoacyl peptidase